MQMMTARLVGAAAGLLMLAGLLGAAAATAAPVTVPPPAETDRCPVCGMVVARYPEWAATVVLEDGQVHHFDGAKDMFKFLLRLDRYAPGHSAGDVAAVAVTDYYDVERIDARAAWYVAGSDVYGPMGHELIPLKSEADARTFMADHGGSGIYRFGQVDAALVEAMDRGGHAPVQPPLRP